MLENNNLLSHYTASIMFIAIANPGLYVVPFATGHVPKKQSEVAIYR